MHADDVGTCAKLYDRMVHVHHHHHMCTVASSKCTIVKMVYEPSLGKTSEDFRLIFTDREAIGKNKQKMPKSPRTSSTGFR